jgi:hypothetical protein
MPKPRDPVINVISYFEHAELALAQQALAMAGAIVKGRSPQKAPGTAKKAVRRRRETEPELPYPTN